MAARLIKERDIESPKAGSLGDTLDGCGVAKSKSVKYQVFEELNSFLRLLREREAYGDVTLHIYKGGINGIEFTETEKIKL